MQCKKAPHFLEIPTIGFKNFTLKQRNCAMWLWRRKSGLWAGLHTCLWASLHLRAIKFQQARLPNFQGSSWILCPLPVVGKPSWRTPSKYACLVFKDFLTMQQQSSPCAVFVRSALPALSFGVENPTWSLMTQGIAPDWCILIRQPDSGEESTCLWAGLHLRAIRSQLGSEAVLCVESEAGTLYIHAYMLQPVPEKMRLEMVIQMQNEIQIGIKKLSC